MEEELVSELVLGSLIRERFVSRDCTQSPALLRFMQINNTEQTMSRKPYKLAMCWAEVTQKKQQQAQVYVSTFYFNIYAYISTF